MNHCKRVIKFSVFDECIVKYPKRTTRLYMKIDIKSGKIR